MTDYENTYMPTEVYQPHSGVLDTAEPGDTDPSDDANPHGTQAQAVVSWAFHGCPPDSSPNWD